jgi:hypothetical protein
VAEKKDWRTALSDWDGGVSWTYEHLPLAVQMAILQELKTLNRIMRCPNVQAGFRALQKISKANDAAFKRRVKAAVSKLEKRSKA